MLRIDSRNVNFNGACLLSDEVIASVSASINDPENTAYVSISIANMRAVRENLAAVQADVAAFLTEISRLPAADEEE